MGILDTITKNKKCILVDFFDTIMFRYIHSDEIRPQWAEKMCSSYPNINANKWMQTRREIIADKDECAVEYEYLVKQMYERFSSGLYVSYESFRDTMFDIDKYVDMAVQYPNRRLITWLLEQKKKGKKIYIVSDYYLPSKAYDSFLSFYDLNDLFNGVFSSSEYMMTKRKGDLYEFVLDKLKVDKQEVIMIGDSKNSDYIAAKNHGIDSYRYFPATHKIYTNIHKRLGNIKIDKYIFGKCLKYTQFAEYGMDLYMFCQQLEQTLMNDLNKSRTINFMSRGGYLLKKAFDIYLNWGGGKAISGLKEIQNQIPKIFEKSIIKCR